MKWLKKAFVDIVWEYLEGIQMFKSKAQTSIEILTIFGVILIAITGVSSYISSTQTGSIRAQQAREAIRVLMQASTEVYDSGGTKTVRIYLPTDVVDTDVSNKTLVIRFAMESGVGEAVGVVDREVELVGHIPTKSGENLVKVASITENIVKVGEGHGVVICRKNYFCGIKDGVCPGDYGADCSPGEDPDC